MVIPSRWKVDIPRCSLQQWIFGSANEPLAEYKAIMDADNPENNFLTLEQFRLLAKRVALGLLAEGFAPGDRVLLFTGNNVYFPSVFLGILMAGGVFTGANPGFVPRELAYQLRDSGARFMLVAEKALGTALEAAAEAGLPRSSIFVLGADEPAPQIATSRRPGRGQAGREDGVRHWTELLADNAGQARTWSWKEPADPETTTCAINYSSGTTGVPKGVEISHYSYVANGVGVEAMDELNPDWADRRRRSRGLCYLPMYHAYGQTYYIANFSKLRIPYYIMPSFDFVKLLQHVEEYRISHLICVPPIVVALAKHPLSRKHDLSSVFSIGSGAAPLARETIEEVQRLWPQGAVKVRQAWGMTEVTCTCIGWDPKYDATTASVGEMMPNCSARLMELDGKTPIERANTPGELWVTGPTLMRGYWRKPEATAATIWVDPVDGTRWLRTGDIAFVEDYAPGALFHIVDRLKELIKVKGNQVAPAELEGVLLERPDVTDAAVVGVTINGEELPRAYIVRAPGSSTSEQEMAEWLAGKVARFKRLRGGVKFIDEIPKNPSGKIVRKQLRERAAAEVGDRTSSAVKL